MFDPSAVLADSSWHHHWWWPFPWLLILIVIALLVWRRGCGPRRGGNARSILAERFARGEISADDYRERLGQLGRRWW